MTPDSGIDVHAKTPRASKFTPERLEQIINLVERGKTREEIAELIGCTVGTLQVTCSRFGVSLRRPKFDNGMRSLPPKRPPPSTIEIPPTMTTPPEVPPQALSHKAPIISVRLTYRDTTREAILPLDLQTIGIVSLEAEIRNMHVTELIAEMIGRIARYDLFKAILDERK